MRTPASNQHLPAVTVAAYAILWIVKLQALEGRGRGLPRPAPAEMAEGPRP